MKLLIMQSSLTSPHFFLLRSKYSPNTLFPNTLNVRFSFSMRDQVSHPHKTALLYEV